MNFLLSLLFSFTLLNSAESSVYQIPRGDTVLFVVFLRVPQTHVVFERKDPLYEGEIELDLKIKGKDRGEIINDYWKFREKRESYEGTLKSLYVKRQLILKVPKDREYSIEIKVKDGKTGKLLKESIRKVKPYGENISDLIPLDPDSFEEGLKRVVYPSYAEGPLLVYFEVREEPVRRVEWLIERDDSTYMRGTKEDISSKDTILIPIEEIPSGEYTLQVDFIGDNFKVTRSLSFSSTSFYRLTDKDYRMLVGALSYIEHGEDLEKLKNAPPEEREKLWREFWEKRDPTPGTPRNEYMEEYIRRVEYVNKHFSLGRWPGYKTDRGMIYIKYGPPDEIEDHPYEWGSRPYVIWYYYSLDRYFVFVDKYGIGDYELVYPYDFPDFR